MSTVTLWQDGDPLSPAALNSKLQPLLSDRTPVDVTYFGTFIASAQTLNAASGLTVSSVSGIPTLSALASVQFTQSGDAVLSTTTVDIGSWLSVSNSNGTAVLSGSAALDALNSSVNQLTTDVASRDSDIINLDSKVTALESGMTLNNTSIVSINSVLSGVGSGFTSLKVDYLGSLISASQTLNFGSGLTVSLVTNVPTITATASGGGSGFTLQSGGSTLASTNTVNFTGFSITSVSGVITIPAPSGSATSIPGHIGSSDLAALSFFQQNSATLSLDTAAGVGTYLLPPVGANQISSADYTLSTPGSDWVHRGHFWLPATDLAGWAGGLTIRESGSGKMVTLFLVRSGGVPTYGLQIWRWAAYNNFTSTIGTVDVTTMVNLILPYTLEIVKSGNTIHYGYNSGVGGPTIAIASEAQTASFTTHPDRVGVGANASSTLTSSVNFDWLSYTA